MSGSLAPLEGYLRRALGADAGASPAGGVPELREDQGFRVQGLGFGV